MGYNGKKALEHIAQVTSRPIAEVQRATHVENWKDILGFSHRLGWKLFADYLTKRGIRTIRGRDRLSVHVPSELFDGTPGQKVELCLESHYVNLFKREYADQFTFVDK